MFQMFPKKYKKIDNGVGGCGLTNPSFSRIFLIMLTYISVINLHIGRAYTFISSIHITKINIPK